MKLHLQTLVAAALLVSSSAFAQNVTVPKPSSGYGQDAGKIVARDTFGECWRSTYWNPSDAIEGCDGAPKKPAPTPVVAPASAPVAAAPVAPAPAPIVAAAPAPVVAPAPAAKPVAISEKINLEADALFDSGKADLKPAGKAKLDELSTKLKGIDLDRITATGHTDSVGSSASNQKLSVKRAEAVKTYLVSKGIDGNHIHTEGKGETQPLGNNKTNEGRAQNRRVEIEIAGKQTK